MSGKDDRNDLSGEGAVRPGLTATVALYAPAGSHSRRYLRSIGRYPPCLSRGADTQRSASWSLCPRRLRGFGSRPSVQASWSQRVLPLGSPQDGGRAARFTNASSTRPPSTNGLLQTMAAHSVRLHHIQRSRAGAPHPLRPPTLCVLGVFSPVQLLPTWRQSVQHVRVGNASSDPAL